MSDLPSAGTTTLPPNPARESSSMGSQQRSTPPDDSLVFIRFKHSQALCLLSNSKLAAPSPPEDVNVKRSEAKLTLQRLGYTWPDILDATPPLASTPSANTLDYEIVTFECEHSIVIGLFVLIMLIVAEHISPFFPRGVHPLPRRCMLSMSSRILSLSSLCHHHHHRRPLPRSQIRHPSLHM